MFRRRRYGSKYIKRRRPYTSVVRTGIGMVMPPRLLTKMKGITLNVVTDLDAGDFDAYTFRLNSIYQYNTQNVNDRPRGYNEIAVFYNRYRVYKVSWMAQIPATADRLMCVALPVNNPVTGITDFQDAIEYPRAIYRQLGYNGNNPVTIRGSLFLPRLSGAPVATYKADDRYSSAIDGNPAEIMDLVVGVYNSSNTNNVGLTFTVQLVYYVELYDPTILPSSDVPPAVFAAMEPYISGKYKHIKASDKLKYDLENPDPWPPGLEGLA